MEMGTPPSPRHVQTPPPRECARGCGPRGQHPGHHSGLGARRHQKAKLTGNYKTTRLWACKASGWTLRRADAETREDTAPESCWAAVWATALRFCTECPSLGSIPRSACTVQERRRRPAESSEDDPGGPSTQAGREARSGAPGSLILSLCILLQAQNYTGAKSFERKSQWGQNLFLASFKGFFLQVDFSPPSCCSGILVTTMKNRVALKLAPRGEVTL